MREQYVPFFFKNFSLKINVLFKNIAWHLQMDSIYTWFMMNWIWLMGKQNFNKILNTFTLSTVRRRIYLFDLYVNKGSRFFTRKWIFYFIKSCAERSEISTAMCLQITFTQRVSFLSEILAACEFIFWRIDFLSLSKFLHLKILWCSVSSPQISYDQLTNCPDSYSF